MGGRQQAHPQAASINITGPLGFKFVLEHHEPIPEVGHDINLLYQLAQLLLLLHLVLLRIPDHEHLVTPHAPHFLLVIQNGAC